VLGTLRVFVEVKVLDPRWDDRLLATLDRGPNPAGYAVHSFLEPVIRRLGEKRPTLQRGILSEVRSPSAKQILADAAAQTLWPEQSTIEERLVQTVHGLGATLIAWTVDNPADMERLVRWEVDGLCTNHPERARRVVDASRAA